MTTSEHVPCPACGQSVPVSRQRCGQRIVCPKCYRSATLVLVGPAGQQRLLLLTNEAALAARIPRGPAAPPPAKAPPARVAQSARAAADPEPAQAAQAQAAAVATSAAALPQGSAYHNRSGPSNVLLMVGLSLGSAALMAALFIAFLLGGAFKARQLEPESPKPGPEAKGPGASGQVPSAELTTPDIVQKCEASVCHIKTPMGTGTGFVVGPGLIASNEHVIGMADLDKITIKFPAQNNATFDRVSVAYAVLKTDLLILRVTGLPASYAVLQPARGTDLRKGDRIVVIGNPKGIDSVVTEGNCGSIQKLGNLGEFLQLSVPINSGNSGGPALTRHGRVAGVVTLKRADAEAIGYAIPGDVLALALHDLEHLPAADVDKIVHTWLAKQVAARIWNACAIAVQLMLQELTPRTRGRALDEFDHRTHDVQKRLAQLRRGNINRTDLEDVEKLAECCDRLSQQVRSPNPSKDAVQAAIREAKGLSDALDARLGVLDGVDPELFVKQIISNPQRGP